MADFDFQQTAQELQEFVNRTPAEIAELRALYEALTQTGVTPVAADDWPVSDPQENVIYRVAGTSSYTDYMWNGTDFIPMATYDNVPTDIPAVGSTDVITAGGVANHGSAFDISEYNKNGETLATYANLAAALSETNVPESVRKGGMSVKFVQTSDNNYVQYRYMLTDVSTAATFTNVANWQGVDDVPTAGSENLVKSGGVADEVKQLNIGQNRIISFRPQDIQSGYTPLIQWYDTNVGNQMNRRESDGIRITSDFFAIDKTKKLTASVGNSDYKLNVVGWADAGRTMVVIANTVQSYDDYLPANLSYFALVIRKTDNTALSVKDVVDYAQVTITSLPNITAHKVAEGVQLIPPFYAVQKRVISVNNLVVELGSWNSGGAHGDLQKISSDSRMRSAQYYLNNGNIVHCLCKDGYECNIYYYNSSTNSNYLTGWRKENKISYNTDYDKVCIVFKRADGGDVSDSDLDCVDYFIIESLLDELATEVLKYADKPSSGYDDFTVSVDVAVANTNDQTLELQDSQTFEEDKGRIYLPSTYSASGKPTRLIIHCHGASQNYNNGNIFPKASSLVTIDYLLAKGYAVLDVNGLPGTHSFYATTCGNPVAYRSYLAAYKWAIAKYNLYKEIFVIGISAGSVPALQISQIKTIPVLACVTYCGIMDTSRGWMLLGGYHGDNSQGPDIKNYLADKFAFVGTRPTLGNIDPCSDDEWTYFVSNWIKISGWNPYTMGISSTMTKEQYREIISVVYGSEVPSWIPSDYSFESIQQMLLAFKIPQRGNLGSYSTMIQQEQKLYDTCSIYRKTPLKMFHATNDGVAPYRYSRYFYEMCKRGGSTVEFRTFPSGGHSPVGDTQSVTIDGQTISTNVLSIEVLDWLQRFETL